MCWQHCCWSCGQAGRAPLKDWAQLSVILHGWGLLFLDSRALAALLLGLGERIWEWLSSQVTGSGSGDNQVPQGKVGQVVVICQSNYLVALPVSFYSVTLLLWVKRNINTPATSQLPHCQGTIENLCLGWAVVETGSTWGQRGMAAFTSERSQESFKMGRIGGKNV